MGDERLASGPCGAKKTADEAGCLHQSGAKDCGCANAEVGEGQCEGGRHRFERLSLGGAWAVLSTGTKDIPVSEGARVGATDACSARTWVHRPLVVKQLAPTKHHREAHMTINNPSSQSGTHSTIGQNAGPGDTHQFGDVQVSTGSQSAYITIELILYLLASIGIFITAAVIDESESGQGFGASEAWFYVTLLTIGFLLSRGLAKIGGRNDSRVL